MRIFSFYVDLKLIYFVYGDFHWIFVDAIVMRMTMWDRMVYPPDTLNRFIPSEGEGVNSYIPRIVLGRILYFVIPARLNSYLLVFIGIVQLRIYLYNLLMYVCMSTCYSAHSRFLLRALTLNRGFTAKRMTNCE